MSTPAADQYPSLSRLRDELRGRLILPSDPEYDEARTVVLGSVDRHPAAIVRVADARDVARVIALARESGAGARRPQRRPQRRGPRRRPRAASSSTSAACKDLDIDVASRTAWAEAGLTAVEYTTRPQPRTGSRPASATPARSGIGGHHPRRRRRLPGPQVRPDDRQPARGRDRHGRRRAPATWTPSSHPDLFWAIRGGGGNFGVVTRFQFRLHAARRRSSAGCSMLPATPETVAGFMAAADGGPRGALDDRQRDACPPMPFVPEELHGQLVIIGDDRATPATRRPASARSRRSARSRTPIADMVAADAATRRCTRPRTRLPPDRGRARTMFMDHVDLATRDDDRRAARGLGRADPRGPAAGAGRRDGARAGRRHRLRPPRRARSWSNVAAFYRRDPSSGRSARPG